MIRNFRHKGLELLWEASSPAGITPSHEAKAIRILEALHAATSAQDMNLPGFKFHALKGNRAGVYAVSVNANWRITFGWDDADAVDVDYKDYH
jgi:toxin HigB-1